MLPDIIASIVSIVCLTLFLRFWHPKESWTFDHEPDATGRAKLLYTGGQVFRAWAPFVILSILVGAWGIKPIKAALDHYTLIKFAIPELHNMVIRDGKPHGRDLQFPTSSARREPRCCWPVSFPSR